MLKQNRNKALKDAVLEIITRHIGKKTADMYCSYYDSHPEQIAIVSAENLLAEFIGKDMAKKEMTILCRQFKIAFSNV